MRNVIDLFSGAGGLSLGASRAGFSVRGSVEIDEFASEVHQLNFSKSNHIKQDVATLSGCELLRLAAVEEGTLSGLIGGPPCQGFSTIGRREEGDSRNDLFGHFFRLVAETKPAFFVAENVPGILDARYDSVRAQALSQVAAQYVILKPIRIQADRYGVPTTRTRIFFIGYDSSKFSDHLTEDNFLPPNPAISTTVGEALLGLPTSISPSWQSAEQGWQTVEKLHGNWFYDRLVGMIPQNVGDPLSIKRYVDQNEVSGCMGTKHTAEVVERFMTTLPGKSDSISKAIRLRQDGLCPTLRAGTSKERGSYQAVRPIHPVEPRVITAREAARLQGFPDWFVFHHTKWHSFRQIGNSVSPLVAEFILGRILQAM